jgi:hypothetical protein
MPSEPESRPDADTGAHGLVTLTMQVRHAPPEPISGCIGIAGEPDRITFRGWVDLMTAISVLLAGRSGQAHRP